MKYRIAVIPGDGIGVEVTREAVACLEAVGSLYGHTFEFSTHLMGGAALDALGVPLPDETLKECLASDVVFLGAVGGATRVVPLFTPRALSRASSYGAYGASDRSRQHNVKLCRWSI